MTAYQAALECLQDTPEKSDAQQSEIFIDAILTVSRHFDGKEKKKIKIKNTNKNRQKN